METKTHVAFQIGLRASRDGVPSRDVNSMTSKSMTVGTVLRRLRFLLERNFRRWSKGALHGKTYNTVAGFLVALRRCRSWEYLCR